MSITRNVVREAEGTALRDKERLLMAYRYLYYVEDNPCVPDIEYDRLEREFRAECNPNSPMMFVGSSLRTTYSDDEAELAAKMRPF